MLKFYVDYNARELLREDVQTIVVGLDQMNSGIPEGQLEVGLKVMLYDEEMECEAILRHGTSYKWVADIIPGTIRHLPEDQWDRFTTR